MWAVIRVNKKKIELFKQDFSKNIDKNFEIYYPKILVNIFKKKLKQNTEINVLGDYMFCFHSTLNDEKKINLLKKFRGLKILLECCNAHQTEIMNFINNCKKNEDLKGYLIQNFYETNLNRPYKFISGPFSQKIFQILNIEKNKIKIKLGKIKTTISKKELLFQPI